MVTASLATGCSLSLFEEQKKQTKVENRDSGLVIPEGLENPLKSEEFSLQKGESKKYSKLLAPNSVLVMLEGSWVDEDDPHQAKIKVEKPSLIKDFPEFIEQGIQSYIRTNDLVATKTATGYKIKKFYTENVGFWFWSSDVDVEELDFDLTVDMQPHGRSGEIYIDVANYRVVDESLVADVAPAQRSSALAIQMLNDVMLEVDYLYRVKVKNEQASVDMSLQLVKNIAGNYVISSQQDIKFVWSQIEDIIEDLGFEIQDEDESLFVYDTVFSKSNGSMWNVFGSDLAKKVNVAEGEYEVALSTSTTGVDISFRAKDGGYLNKEQMENLFKLFFEAAKEDGAEL